MRANLGFLLIGAGLVGIYIALGGKFKGSSKVSGAVGKYDAPFANNPVPVAGGASQPANVPTLPGAQVSGKPGTANNTANNIPSQRGSGGESIQSRLTQLGHVLVLHPLDRHASRGGF